MKIWLFVFLFAITSTHAADVIAFDRLGRWTNNAGLRGGIPGVTTVSTTLTASGGDDTAAVSSALSGASSNEVVKLNAGTFNLNGLDYESLGDGKVLRGTTNSLGYPTTKILLIDDIYVRSAFSLPNTNVSLSSDAVQGAFTVQCTIPVWAAPGRIIWISQLDDAAYCEITGLEGDAHGPLFYSTGVDRGMCQLNKVISTNGTTITFENPLLWGYSTAQTAQIHKGWHAVASDARRRIGFEDLIFEGNDADTATDMIRFEGAAECWVKNCQITNMIGRAGVYIDFSYRIEVRSSRISNSHSFGSGQAYGVAFYNGSTACLIEDNILDQLHIGIDLSPGIGNVIIYNAFGTNISDSGTHPSIAPHGSHTFMNLIEGNYIPELISGDITHGSGSHLTIFRNRATGLGTVASNYRMPIVQQYYNRFASIAGNVLGTESFHTNYDAGPSGAQITSCNAATRTIYQIGCEFGGDSIAASQILRELNSVGTNNVRVIESGGFSTNDLEGSYFHPSKPGYFSSLAWPPYDPTHTESTASITNIQAGHRFVFGTNFVAASVPSGAAQLSGRAPQAGGGIFNR